MKKIILLLLVPIFCFSQNPPSTLIFSEYGEGSSFNKWIEIYNPTNQQINMDEYRYNFCWNGCDSLLWEFSLAFDSGRVLMPGETYLIVHNNADSILLNNADQITNLLSNGNDVCAIFNLPTNSVIDIIGEFTDVPPNDGWDIELNTNATKNQTLIRKDSVCGGNFGNWNQSNGLGSISSSEWIVNSQDDFSDIHNHNSICTSTPSSLTDNSRSKKIIKIVNIFGQKVNKKTKNTPIIYIYDDGSSKKIITK